MAVLVYAESPSGQLKKAAFEAVCYGKKVATQLGTECIALTIGQADNAGQLGKYGADKVMTVDGAPALDSSVYTAILAQAAQSNGANVIITTYTSSGKSIAPRVAARMGGSLASGAVSYPDTDGGFKVKKNVFSGKAVATLSLDADVKVISIMPNTFKAEECGSDVNAEAFAADIPASKVTVKEVKGNSSAGIPLPEAELVVSAGRGMKGPENWGMIEELAETLGATTACSRPVADIGWRPHHEHVGQTGVAIRPNLYFAIGISGAIQHLAGVNQSKVIVVINTDPEAPFFKAADYGVVGDAFEVVPKLTAAIKKLQSA